MLFTKNELTTQSGIYAIINGKKQVIYIGSAEVFYNRWHRHRKDLRNNKHHSRVLQRVYNKYGETVLSFIILELCTKNRLLMREQHYLDYYDPVGNSAKTAGSPKGVKHSPESNEKKRIYALANGIKPPTHNEIPVIMLDKVTEEPLQTFSSMAEACRYCGKDHQWVSMIRDVLVGKRKTAMGYKWKTYRSMNE